MDNVSKTNNDIKHRFTVVPCADGLTDKSGAKTNTKLAGELVKATNDSLAAANVKVNAQRKHMPVALMYGFVGVRDLAQTNDVHKITVDLLNRALMLSHGNLSHAKLIETQKGIKVRDSAVVQLAKVTRIDDGIAGQLLHSWSAYLKNSYDFISIQSALKRRFAKRTQSKCDNLKYLAIKNYALESKITSATIAGAMFIFDKFDRFGDEEGFKALERLQSPQKEQIAGIVGSMFFRRTSKLGLLWSKENDIPVYFDMDFTHKQAFKKLRNTYQPITFSEYKYYKKYRFDNVTERRFFSQEPPFYLQCLGRK
ncbi:hypothetical protein [Sodalis sp. dw_96]|uniref:hypothetical protein n=1 Tax=Sodalis sp. dw_96 TaxID=2719794 RepID=UPI001BD29FF7|nr:hypothetical protein [Sodalis sp. dw_96]